MFIRYNSAIALWEYDTSAGQTGAGPWLKLPVDISQMIGILSSASLPDNVAYKDIDNQFTLGQTLPQGTTIRGQNSVLYIVGLANPADSRTWRTITYGDGPLHFEAMNDAITVVQGRISFARNGDFRAGNTISERGRSLPMGDWQAFTPAYIAGGAVVPSGGTLAGSYTLIGKTMIYLLTISGFGISGANNGEFFVSMPLPAAAGLFGNVALPANYSPNGVSWLTTLAYTSASSTVLKFYNNAWSVGTTSYIWATFIVPIQFFGFLKMANWNLPTITSGYINFVDEINAKFVDSATLQNGAPTNFPLNTIRWNRSINLFQEWLGASTGWQNKILSVAGGGTGASTSAGIISNLGLGSMSTQNSNAVNITGGSITGVNFDAAGINTGVLALARGGTGASNTAPAFGNPLISNGGTAAIFGEGIYIPTLNAAALTMGIVPLARLDGVGKLADANSWAARQIFNGDVLFSGSSLAWACTVFSNSSVPVFNMYGGAAGPNRKWSRFVVFNGDLHYQRLGDDYSAATSLFSVSWDGVLGGNAGTLYNLTAANLAGTVPIAALGTNPASANAGTFLRGDNTWASVATGGTIDPIPSGMIAAFDVACPAGWTRYAQLDNRFPLGSASAGATGGSSTHSHGTSGSAAGAGSHSHGLNASGPVTGSVRVQGDTGNPAGTQYFFGTGGGLGTASWDHHHPVDLTASITSGNANVSGSTDGVGNHTHTTSGSTDVVNHNPPYYTVVYCRKNQELKVRTLKFEDNDLSKKRFETVFHGLIVSGNTNTQKGLTVLKREIAILDKLEVISKPCECGKKLPGLDESDRELDFSISPTLELHIDDMEFDLLYDYIGKVPWSIGSPARLALQTLDWLKNPQDYYSGSKAS